MMWNALCNYIFNNSPPSWKRFHGSALHNGGSSHEVATQLRLVTLIKASSDDTHSVLSNQQHGDVIPGQSKLFLWQQWFTGIVWRKNKSLRPRELFGYISIAFRVTFRQMQNHNPYDEVRSQLKMLRWKNTERDYKSTHPFYTYS